MSAEPLLARITSTRLGPEDHGIFTASIQLNYGHSTQGAGDFDLRSGASCRRFIEGVLRVCQIDTWEQIPGQMVYALFDEPRGLVRGLRGLPFNGDHEFLFASIYDDEAGE